MLSQLHPSSRGASGSAARTPALWGNAKARAEGMGAAASLVTVPLSMMSGCSSALTGCCATMGGACLANMTCKACTCACVVPKKLASIIYASTLMFFVVFAYIMRYNGGDWVIGGGYNATEASYMEQMQHLAKKGTGVLDDWNGRFWCAPRHPDAWVICCEDVCGGVFAVYRVSFALCLFFAFLALCTCGTTVFGAKAHRGFWFAKIFLLLGLVISTFFIDNHAMEGYRETARYLSWAFLMLQILLLIDFGCASRPLFLRRPPPPSHVPLPPSPCARPAARLPRSQPCPLPSSTHRAPQLQLEREVARVRRGQRL